MSNRREFLKSSLWATGAAVAASACTTTPSQRFAANSDALSGPVYNLASNPEDNALVYAKMVGDLDPTKSAAGWYSGYVSAVQPNKKVTDLIGFEGFSFAKLLPQPDGTFHKVLREVGLYTDLKSGEVLEEWKNPLTGEMVNVVPVANDPFNQTVAPYFELPPSYGGLNKEADAKPPKIPFILPWKQRGNQIHMERHINLFYPNALQPEKWPRESAGRMARVTEAFAYFIDPSELQNANSTKVIYNGTWSRITPWLPWMLMGQAEGHCQYQCYMGGGQDLEQVVSRNVIDYVEKHYPKYMDAPGPEAWEQDSLSSIERYALEQTPAPAL